jgi:hypothetical protein
VHRAWFSLNKSLYPRSTTFHTPLSPWIIIGDIPTWCKRSKPLALFLILVSVCTYKHTLCVFQSKVDTFPQEKKKVILQEKKMKKKSSHDRFWRMLHLFAIRKSHRKCTPSKSRETPPQVDLWTGNAPTSRFGRPATGNQNQLRPRRFRGAMGDNVLQTKFGKKVFLGSTKGGPIIQ